MLSESRGVEGQLLINRVRTETALTHMAPTSQKFDDSTTMFGDLGVRCTHLQWASAYCDTHLVGHAQHDHKHMSMCSSSHLPKCFWNSWKARGMRICRASLYPPSNGPAAEQAISCRAADLEGTDLQGPAAQTKL